MDINRVNNISMSINTTYADWDSVIIQLNLGDAGKGSIKMMRQDIEAMSELHGQTTSDIMAMMLEALKEQHDAQVSNKNTEDAVSQEL